MKILKQLLLIKKKPISIDEASSLGINVGELRNKGLILIKVTEEKEFIIPKDVPRYAKRFAFTRKKYGITESISKTKHIHLSNNGIKFISKSVKKELEEETKPIKEVEDEVQD